MQSAHAAVEFAARYPEAAAGGYLIMLVVPDEEALATVAIDLKNRGIDSQWFYEPDQDGELTAIAAEGDRARRRLARLPLLFREEVKTGV